MVQREVHSPTPPPVIEVFRNEEDVPNSWYWEEHGGGMVINFGKHKGEKIHEVSLSYLLWCRSVFQMNARNVRGYLGLRRVRIYITHALLCITGFLSECP